MVQTLKVNSEWKQKGGERKLYKLFTKYFIVKEFRLYIVGFLLGRAIILFNISPFAIAFLAAVWVMQPKRIFILTFFMMLGAWTQSTEQMVYIALSIGVFMLFTYFLKERDDSKMLIVIVFLAMALTRLALFSIAGELNVMQGASLLIEGMLGGVLLLIFMQSMPLIAQRKYKAHLKSEELVCLVILIVSVLTGLIGWEVYGAALEHVFSRYIVLLLAFVGGAAIGSTVGVVAGIILSLAYVANISQISLLAFAGLLGGLLKDGNKHGVSLGLFIGTLLIGMYGGAISLSTTMLESGVAILLFYLTPKSLLVVLSKYIPGTMEYSHEERKYLQKVRDITAQRVSQFSSVFEALSKSFIQSTEKQSEQEGIGETDYYLSLVTEKTCQQCFMKKKCWQQNFDDTYELMKTMKEELIADERIAPITEKRFEKHCVKSAKVTHVMKSEVSMLQVNKNLKQQVNESKKIVAEQLKGVSDVMDNFADEIVKEREYHEQQEIGIVRALKQMDIHVEGMDIYQLEKGNIDIEMTINFREYRGEAEKLIAPVLADVLEENIIVKEERISPYPKGTSFLSFGSAKQFNVSTGVATAAKGGGLISGDCYTTIELGEGRYVLAISDGMGNGVRAREESSETLKLLEQILHTGISEQVAIKSINSILALRTTDEVFATLDLAIINLHNAIVRFLKIGSSPSFIKRGNEIIQIESSNLPIGIIEHVELDAVNERLRSGDVLIMMSDGLYEGVKQIKNNDVWIRRKIAALQTNDPQAIADVLLEEVIREEQGRIHDDITVVVSKVERHIPKWSTIPVTFDEAR